MSDVQIASKTAILTIWACAIYFYFMRDTSVDDCSCCSLMTVRERKESNIDPVPRCARTATRVFCPRPLVAWPAGWGLGQRYW